MKDLGKNSIWLKGQENVMNPLSIFWMIVIGACHDKIYFMRKNIAVIKTQGDENPELAVNNCWMYRNSFQVFEIDWMWKNMREFWIQDGGFGWQCEKIGRMLILHTIIQKEVVVRTQGREVTSGLALLNLGLEKYSQKHVRGGWIFSLNRKLQKPDSLSVWNCYL